MNVNLSSRDLLDSYNQVLSGDPQCEWTIFTYGGGTMDLKVQADGSGGLEELKEEFMDGRIQYAFIRITDGNSGLPKFVQINWCGDGVPESKKGLFNNHSNTVARFFKAAHMQVNARNEDDINPSLIKKRLAEAGGAAYSVHKESQSRSSGGGPAGGNERIAPVGSSYQPIKVDMGALRSGAKKDVIAPGSAYVPTKANLNSTPAPVQATRSIPPPQAARPSPPPQAQTQPPAKAVDDDDTWGEEPPAVGARPAFVASSPTPKPAYVAPQTSFYKPPPPKTETPTPAAATAPAKPAADDKIGPVGTAYTPVSLPAPKKLASRWGQPAASEEPVKPSYGGGGASRFGGGAGAAGGGEKKLTWSERQAQAKARDAEEEKGSLAATAAVVGTTVASGASKVASSLPSFPARSTPPAPKAPAPDSDDGFDEPDAPPPPPAPPLASRPPPQASAAPSFPDEDDFDEPDAPPPPPPAPARAPIVNAPPSFPDDDEDFDEPDAPPPPPPPAPVARAPIVNAAPSFPDDDDFKSDGDEPPAVPPPPPSAPVAAVAAVVAAPVESAKKAYESIKESLVGPSEPVEESKAGEGAGGGKKAKVLFDYEATEDNELALREGEILVELEMVDEGWWSAKGETGDVGLFPANYVELLEDEEEEEAAPPPPPAAPAPPPRAPTPEPEADEHQGVVATALYDYDAAESNELSFKDGDRIHSIEEASEDWWSGVAPDGSTGLFPSNYVEVQK
ncbi:hypothetical protein BDY24DRAFT_269726 [Mrakia frigida]|uniref:uncharacterized protein n=1 Tax=Mrakia frigida TaxID=29902 RepID=UPI003FCC1E90